MFEKNKEYTLENDWSYCSLGEDDDIFVLQSKEGKSYAFDMGYGSITIKINGETYECLHFLQELEMTKINGGTVEERAEQLTDIFYEEGNNQLRDPIVFGGDQEDDMDLVFSVGDEEEFISIIKLCLLADFKITDELILSINSATDEDSASMEIYDGSIEDDNTSDLIDSIIEKFAPFGHRTEYNDGAYNRRSGYSKRAKYIEITFKPQDYSNHERLESIKKLDEKLKEYGISR